MIRIPIDDIQKFKIEEIYRTWIKRHLKTFKKTIERDKVLFKLIFGNNEYSEDGLMTFLLMNTNEMKKIKEECANVKLKGVTIKYLLARYKNFRSSQAAKIANELHILSCPYCNQNYIISYKKNGELKFSGDLDHYYNKSTYPALMLCLYNLIPSCKVCNQIKSSKSKRISNPYNTSYKSNITFKTTFNEKNDIDYLFGKSNNFNIEIDDINLLDEDKNEIELFDLSARYEPLKDNAREIIIKSMAYRPIYNQKIGEMFDELSPEELDQFIYGYRKNHLKRSLSKFNQDIMNEFKKK